MSNLPPPSPAKLMAVDRNQARPLFALKDDNELAAEVDRLAAEITAADADCCLSLDPSWPTIVAALDQLVAGNDAPEFAAAAEAIGRGRPLYHGGDRTITLVRPDMPPHVLAALKQVDRETFESALNLSGDAPVVVSEQPIDQLWANLQSVMQLYDKAAEDRCAVVFATDK